MTSVESNRRFLRNDGWSQWDTMMPDQKRGIPPPPVQKPVAEDAMLIELKSIQTLDPPKLSLFEAIAYRRSIREYSNKAVSLSELSLLLWATQGIHVVTDDMSHSNRSVPSAGARHPFETYLFVKKVEDLLQAYIDIFLSNTNCVTFIRLMSSRPGHWMKAGSCLVMRCSSYGR